MCLILHKESIDAHDAIAATRQVLTGDGTSTLRRTDSLVEALR